VDLRPGDDVMLNGMWRQVIGLTMHSELMLTDEQAAEHEGRGWLVKAPEGYVSPIGGGSVRRGAALRVQNLPPPNSRAR
jgi:hypothetical protein